MDINVLTLAYIGDSVYELYIRKYLIDQGITKVNNLQKEAIKYVSAKGQAKYLKELVEDNFLNQEELDIYYRTRNHKSHKNKTTDIITYKHASGLEAVIGYLYLQKKYDRIKQIMDKIISN